MGFAASRGTKSAGKTIIHACFVGVRKMERLGKISHLQFKIYVLGPMSFNNPLAIICRHNRYIYTYIYAYDIMICCISNRWYMVDTYVIGPQSISFGWRNRAWVCPGFQKWPAAWSTRPSTTESSCNRFQSQWSLRIHPLVYTGSQATQAPQRLDQGLKEVPSQWSDQAVARRDVGAGC